MVFQESQLSVLWLQQVWGLHAGGQHAVSFLHLVRVLVSAKQLKNIAQGMIYSSKRGTNGLNFISWLNHYYLVFLDWFPLLLHFFFFFFSLL